MVFKLFSSCDGATGEYFEFDDSFVSHKNYSESIITHYIVLLKLRLFNLL